MLVEENAQTAINASGSSFNNFNVLALTCEPNAAETFNTSINKQEIIQSLSDNSFTMPSDIKVKSKT